MTTPSAQEVADVALADVTAAQVYAAISLALREGDMPAAAALVGVLALKDPAGAALIVDAVHLLAWDDAVRRQEGQR